MFDITIRAVGLMATLATAGFGVAVYRSKIDDLARQRFQQLQVETITLQAETITQLRIAKRVVEDTAANDRRTREHCEKNLDLALRTIRAYDNFVGRAWIESATGDLLEAAKSGTGASVPLDQRQLLAREAGGDPGTADHAGRAQPQGVGEDPTAAADPDAPLPQHDDDAVGRGEGTEADQRRRRTVKHKQERGQTLVEYGLLVALLTLIVVVSLIFLGPIVSQVFTDTGQQLNQVP